MHGNLWEWCADAWHDSYDGAPIDDRVWQATGKETYRVARGGCWHDIPGVCRSAARLKVDANDAEEIHRVSGGAHGEALTTACNRSHRFSFIQTTVIDTTYTRMILTRPPHQAHNEVGAEVFCDPSSAM